MLAKLVKEGKLPPVEQRLPEEPLVVQPVEKVGQFGGTWRRVWKGPSDRWGISKLIEVKLALWDKEVESSFRGSQRAGKFWKTEGFISSI